VLAYSSGSQPDRGRAFLAQHQKRTSCSDQEVEPSPASPRGTSRPLAAVETRASGLGTEIPRPPVPSRSNWSPQREAWGTVSTALQNPTAGIAASQKSLPLGRLGSGESACAGAANDWAVAFAIVLLKHEWLLFSRFFLDDAIRWLD
jgi:hypothetical protein